MAVSTYDPKQVAIIFGGFSLSGFADGSFVTVERNEDAFTLQMGTDGEGTRSKSNNKSGRVTVRLMQSSESNAILSGIAKSDELSNSGVQPLMVKDNSGASLYVAEQSWIVKMPSAEYDREASEREWIIETDSLQMFEGGN
jgi:hypothetical protein